MDVGDGRFVCSESRSGFVFRCHGLSESTLDVYGSFILSGMDSVDDGPTTSLRNASEGEATGLLTS